MHSPIHYCSYFDHRYLARALCLYDSLRTHSPDFVWHVLALSDTCEQVLNRLRLPGVEVHSLGQLEAHLPRLLVAKSNRSIVEYYFTLTSSYCHYLLERIPPHALLTYLDSDLYFFSSPMPIFDEIGSSSIAIIEHRFSEANRTSLIYGRFNVGWVSFRNDDSGRRCLLDWFEKCFEWCYDRVEEGRFADQKYLDVWPEQFDDVHIIQHPGANVAPWNISDFKMAEKVPGNGPVNVHGDPLVFAHFQNVRALGYRTYETGFDVYRISPTVRKAIVDQIYLPYLRQLHRKQRNVTSLLPQTNQKFERELRHSRQLLADLSLGTLVRFPKKYFEMTRRFNWISI